MYQHDLYKILLNPVTIMKKKNLCKIRLLISHFTKSVAITLFIVDCVRACQVMVLAIILGIKLF